MLICGENGTFGRIGGINEANGCSVAIWVKFGGSGMSIRRTIGSNDRCIGGQLKRGELGNAWGREKQVSVTKF